MPLRCTECGDGSKTFESKRQARGHVKFKSGGAHGDAQEVPSDWEDLFEEVDEGKSSEPDDDSGCSASGSRSGSPDDSGDDTGGSDDGSSDSSDDESGGSSDGTGFLRRLVDTDVRELIRSDG